MTDAERDAVRAKVRADDEMMKKGLAQFFLGKTCPISRSECLGPECPWFLVSGEQEGNRRVITGGNCSIPLIASQVGPIAEGLSKLAFVAATPQAPTSAIIPVRG